MAVEWYPQIYPVDYTARTDGAFYKELWDYVKPEILNIQEFQFELANIKKSYDLLSGQAVAIGRNDLLSEVLAGIERVNTITNEWITIKNITDYYYREWPAYLTGNASPSAWGRNIDGINFQEPVDSLAYVYVYWPPIKEKLSQEFSMLIQLRDRIASIKPATSTVSYFTTPTPSYLAPSKAPEDILHILPIPVSTIAPVSEDEEIWHILPTNNFIDDVTQAQQASLAPDKLFGIPTLYLIVGAGIIFFLMGRGKGKS